ncbi:MAG TPA: GH1 family beta-glucosidase [Ktedonobacteraceae bacterium]|nr:GH1 family beta-glucosidase [Ktedonobacteraceae bacterium]
MTQFPENFCWGVATAAYQIEGAAHEEGRGESIWDRFCENSSATPPVTDTSKAPPRGKVLNNDSGLVAVDHYHRYLEDVRIMRDLGINAYRFSIAWPRILPTGRGQVNAAGLDFYDRLVDSLLAANIEPFVTLYHWDLPQALQDEVGGWASRETAKAFASYADIVSRRLGDRVHHWITLNEPSVSAFMGYETGEHAPGLRNPRIAWQSTHNFLLAHGLAVPTLRANGDAQTRVGVTLVIAPVFSATKAEEDRRVAQFLDGKLNRWFLDPLFRGCYPSDVQALLGNMAPKMEDGDSQIIARPIDFLGVNYYFRMIVRHLPGQQPLSFELVQPQGSEYTAMGWEVYPPGLYAVLTRLHQEYAIPQFYITESGAAFDDTISADGQVHDPQRVEYLQDHFQQARAAIADGVPLAGYFIWTLMDNFEWAFGSARRFGIVYTHYPTLRRIIKDSGYWYRGVIASKGEQL